MPDKEGSEDGKKSTKSVVNKKQKQMMGEEGYDTYRDNILMRGGDHRSKETRERSNTPTGKQPKGKTVYQKQAEKKYGKGKSALDMVKADITAKYGKGAIMDVKNKKKANEELDLTKIAEAFGGYVIEQDISDPWDEKESKEKKQKAKKQAEKDIKKTPVDPRFSGKEDEFASDTETSKPQEKNPLRKKNGNIKPGSVKFTQRPGEKPVKSYKDPSQIDPKIAAREKAKRKESKKKPTAAELAKDRDEKLGAKSFKKDIGGEKIISPTMQDRLEKATTGPRKARKRRKDAASFAQVKADIDMADAARKAKGKGEYASDYEKRLAKAYDKSLEGTVKTGRAPAGSPLPQAKTKTPQGQPQKGQADQSDAAQEFNKQQNIARRLQRQGMADSGATPFKQPPLPDPKTGPSSKLTFSKFQQDQQKRFAQNKKDMEAADAYKQTPEYKLQTQQVDPDTKEILSKDELKRRFQMQKRGIVSPERRETERKESERKAEIEKNTPRDQRPEIDRTRTSNVLDPRGGFERGRRGTLSRRGTKPESPNVETMPQQIGRKFKDMADKTQTAQQSFLGALGGFVTKGVSSSAAGAEAGMRYARGDKTGAALSALQGLGGGVGFAAGVANAIKSMRIAKGGKTAGLAKVVPPEDLAMAAATGGAVIPQLKGALSKLPKGVPGVQGGRVGRRSAPS